MDCPTFVRCRFCSARFENTQALGRHLAGNTQCYEGHYSAPAPARFDRRGGVVFFIPCRGRRSPVGGATDDSGDDRAQTENGGSTSPNVLPSVNRGTEEMDGGGAEEMQSERTEEMQSERTEEMQSERTEEMQSERTEESEGAGSDGEGTPSPSRVANTSCSSGIVESDVGATPPGPRVNWHPALLKLLEFVDTANGGMSLSKMDKGKLIQLLLVPELAHVLVAENMRTCRDLERLQLEYIAGTGRGFLTTTFVVEGYPPQVLYHRDIMRELARMFGHQHNAKGFRFRPKVVVDGDTNERTYTTAETGTWWNEAQAFVGPEVVIAALLFYSDVTHLSNNGRKKAHPVMMTLANIPLPKRWGKAGHSLLALLPIPPKGMPPRVKTELFNKCIAKIMEPIRQAKERGVMLEDADGDLHNVIPMFYGWACDYPESGKVTGTLSGQGCSKPCSLCYVDKENLSSVHLENNMRTPELQ
ncbi:unnamed protein product [Closterium sp. Yama58-4]|nr:unnamed protein product [Closterium sp. Yama58-4]